jgi:hypothetical protein
MRNRALQEAERPNHAYVFIIRTDEAGWIRSWPPHVPDGLVEAGKHDEEQDEHGDAPGRASLSGGAPVAGPPAALAGVESEEVAVEGVDGGDPADEEHERDGHGQQRPAELLRRLLDEVLVGEEPRDAQQERDHEQDQDHRVRQRRQRERLHDRRLRAPVAVVRHGRSRPRWLGLGLGPGSSGDSCSGGRSGGERERGENDAGGGRGGGTGDGDEDIGGRARATNQPRIVSCARRGDGCV